MIDRLLGADYYSNEDIVLINTMSSDEDLTSLKNKDNILFCPLNLETGLKLVQKGFKIIWPHNLVDLSDSNEVGEVNIKRTKQLCAILDGINDIQHGKHGIDVSELFGCFYFQLKTFIDSIVVTYNFVNRLISKVDIHKIQYFSSIMPGEINLLNAELYLSKILLGKYGIKSFECTNRKKNYNIISFLSNNLNTVTSYLGLLKNKHLKDKHLRDKSENRTANIYVLDHLHDVPYLYRLLRQYFNVHLVHFGTNSILIKHLDKIIPSLILYGENKDSKWSEFINDLFDRADKDDCIFDLFDDKFLVELILELIKEYYGEIGYKDYVHIQPIKTYFKKKSCDYIILSSTRKDLLVSMLISYLRMMGVKVVVYQEGGGAGYLNYPFFGYELTRVDYFLGYGTGVKNSIYLKEEKEKILPVGSLRLSSIRKNNIQGKNNKLFFVVDNIKDSFYQHYPNNGGVYSKAFTNQLKILNTLTHFKNKIDIVIKTIKPRQDLYEFVRSLGFMLETRPLENVLAEAGGFILDAPSTVLLECMTTSKPIALLHDTDQFTYDLDIYTMLEKRVFLGVQGKNYCEKIDEVVTAIEKEREYANNEFIETYGLNDDVEEKLNKELLMMSCRSET